MTTRSYSPADWQITILGILANQGIAKGTFLKITRNTESAKMEVGAGGDVVVTAMLDRSGKLELTLQRESAINRRLSTALVAFEARPRVVGAGIGTVLVKNTNQPLTRAGAPVGVIEKWPDMEGADAGSTCAWSILLDDVTMFHDGATA